VADGSDRFSKWPRTPICKVTMDRTGWFVQMQLGGGAGIFSLGVVA